MSQARNWCLRLSNPTESSDEFIDLFKDKSCRYLVFQKERGEENGLIHYQGYVEFSKVYRLGALKKIHNSIHWEPRRGTRDEARNYCIKEETRVDGPWEYGDFGQKRGHRSDLEELYKLARSAKTLTEVAEAMPGTYMRNYKAVQHVRQLPAFSKPPPRPEGQLPDIILYLGPPGTGKTRKAYQESPDLYATPVGKTLWFDGYCGEPDILLDDFSGNFRLVDTFRLLDTYTIQVPIKGGHVWYQPKRLFITSNNHPRDWYNFDKRKNKYPALVRRFTQVVLFEENEEPKIVEDLKAFFFN